MKKITSFMLMLLCAMTAWAQSQTADELVYEINNTNAVTKISGWKKTWQNSDGLTLSVGANNMTVAGDSDILQLFVGSSKSSTYTITAPEGYYVSSYSFEYEKVDANVKDWAYYLTQNGVKYYPAAEPRTLSVNNLVQKTATFKMDGENKGIYVKKFIVTVRKYGVLPELTTDVTAPKYYTIQNVRTQKFVKYRDNANWLQQDAKLHKQSLFYFTGEKLENGHLKVKIHNATTENKMANFGAWNTDGTDWYIRLVGEGYGNYPGIAISKNDDLSNSNRDSWNSRDSNNEVGDYWSNDGGSTFVFTPYEKHKEELPQMSTESNKIFYYVKGLRNNKYATYDGEGNSVKLKSDKTENSYWYFVKNPDVEAPEGYVACYIYNAANAKPLNDPASGTYNDGKTYYIKFHSNSNLIGYAIYHHDNNDGGWNDNEGKGTEIGNYSYDDIGSIWYFEPVGCTEACLLNSAVTAKNNALNHINEYSKAYYYNIISSSLDAFLTKINNYDVSTLQNALATLMAGIEEQANELVNASKVEPADGDRFIMKNKGRSGYLRAYSDGNVKCTTISNDLFALDLVWKLVATENEGEFKLYNEKQGVYIGALNTTNDQPTAYTTDITAAGVYEITQNGIYTLFHAKGQDSNGYMHLSNHDDSKIVRWDNGACSQWQLFMAPFELTTDIDNPICYAIKSGRPGNFYFTLDNNKIKLFENRDIATDNATHWFFMLDENKNLKIYSLADKNNTMGYITVGGGDTKLTNDHTVANFVGDTYTLYFNDNNAANHNDKYFAFRPTTGNTFVSNHGGTGNYMGFHNVYDDNGTRVAFECVKDITLQQKIATWRQYLANEGDGLAQYVISDDKKEVVNKAEIVANSKSKNYSDFASALEKLNAMEFPNINAPATNKYYYLKANGKYLSNALNGGTIAAKDEKDVDNIYYLEAEGENTYLVSYQNGKYLTNPWNIGIGADPVNSHTTERYKQTKTFVEGNFGYYALKYFSDKGATYYIHVSGNSTNASQDKTINEAQWTLEEVTSLPVTISAAKYATFHAPVAVEIADGVTAYTATINGNWVTLTEIESGVIPANTGVVLYADVEEATTYNFDITENVKAIEGNALCGSVATTYYTAAGTYYALGVVDGVTAFYKDKLNNNRFQNNSHKAYLFIPGASGSANLRFDFGGTTAVEEITEQRAESKEIYDLTGRSVNEITKAGVYVVNGRKILVK